MEYTQVIIRCYTDQDLLALGFEDMTTHVPKLWVCETDGVSIDSDEAAVWLFERLRALNNRKKHRELNWDVVVFLQMNPQGSYNSAKIDSDLIQELHLLNAEIELYLSPDEGSVP
jgi:hypothetical protein